MIEQIEQIKAEMEYLKDPYEGVALGTRIDFGNLEFTYENDHYVLIIPVQYHSKNNDKTRILVEPRMEEEFEEFRVTLRYNEKGKRWLIHDCIPYAIYIGDWDKAVKSEFK